MKGAVEQKWIDHGCVGSWEANEFGVVMREREGQLS